MSIGIRRWRVNKLSGRDKHRPAFTSTVYPSAPDFLSFQPVRQGGHGCPPHFGDTNEVYGMSDSRNEFRELVFIAILLSLLIISVL
jgi:hypothetical protein